MLFSTISLLRQYKWICLYVSLYTANELSAAKLKKRQIDGVRVLSWWSRWAIGGWAWHWLHTVGPAGADLTSIRTDGCFCEIVNIYHLKWWCSFTQIIQSFILAIWHLVSTKRMLEFPVITKLSFSTCVVWLWSNRKLVNMVWFYPPDKRLVINVQVSKIPPPFIDTKFTKVWRTMVVGSLTCHLCQGLCSV